CSFFFSSRRRHTRFSRDWSSDVCSSDLEAGRVDAVRRRPAADPVDAVTREILDSAHGKVGNTWREALIKARGLTKRQARALIADIAPWAADATPLDLPLHRLTSLPDAVRACLARAAG